MQHYQQLQSACGLAASLMIISPINDVDARRILDSVGEKVKVAFPSMSDWIDDPITRHQVSSAYAILKAAKSPEIHELLTKYDALEYEFAPEVIIYELEKRMRGKSLEKRLKSYQKKGKFDKEFLHEYTTKIKTDVELKLLLALFGYRFVRFPYSPDGTGSVNIEIIDHIVNSELIQDSEYNSYDEILEFMLTFLKVHFAKSYILINTGFHWVPAAKMVIDDKRYPELFYLDSTRGAGELVKLLEWDKSKWFYVFQFDGDLQKQMMPVLQKVMDIDN
ncbi:MAG: hypothetical protein ACTSUE_26025 [Promethearchaeota archaeon]